KYVVENHEEVGAALVTAMEETAEGVARGDAGAITRATATLAELATGGKAVVSGVGKGVKVARRLKQRLKQRSGRKTEPPKLVSKGREVEPTYCFVAGTLITTATGLRPIEEIEVGDLVWARSEATGEQALRRVVQLFVTPDQPVLKLEIEAPNGTSEVLGTTREHPFWVEELGWVPASRLRPGDRLVSNTGGWLRVRQVRGSPRRETVYNFEVSEDHTYFVGETGVWVHNLCEAGKARLAELRERRAERLAGKAQDPVNPEFAKHVAAERQINKATASLAEGPYHGPWYDPQATRPPGGGTWGDFIDRMGGGVAPTGGPISHGHHIFLKRGRGKKGRAIAREGHAILREAGIDPIIGPDNLTHAPLHGVGIHTRARQKEVLEGLRALKAQGTPRDEYVRLLQEFGERARNAPVNQ
ncbi:MAG: hypothetical protein GY722_28770, partial [bacterium]|nr:hypothetical protein [bacterium]